MRKVWVIVTAGAVALWSCAAAASPVELVYGDWQAAQKEWNQSLTEALKRFEALNPDIKVILEPVALGQRDVKYTTAIRAGKGPDVFALDAPPSKQYIANGWALDLTPYVSKEPDSWLKDFYPQSLGVVQKDNHTYGIPQTVMAILFAYNEKLFKEAGIDSPPRTWAEFRQVAKKLTRSSSGGIIDRWATTIPIGPGCFDLRWSAFMRSFGARVLTKDYTHSALNTPEAKEAFNYFLALVDDKVIPPGVAQVDCNGARQLMVGERVAMVLESIWTASILKQLDPKFPTENIKYMPMPTKEGKVVDPRTTLYQKSLYVNPHTKNADAAWKLVKFLTDKEQMERWFQCCQNLAARKSVNRTSPVISKDADAQVLSGEIEHADFVPLMAEWPEISETLRKAVQDAVAKTKKPDEALTAAHERIEAILARRKP
jgi:multiple sugar transport system substrate-binding protein